MGGTNWSAKHYEDNYRAANAIPTFAHHAAMAAAPEVDRKAHDTLNPFGVKVRESRDSEAHPESRAVAVMFDVTGSMKEVPKVLQANLPKLMGLLLRKGYLEHPHILVGGIGDATWDRVPLQVGQFEAGIEIESDLTNLFLEGGGGGHLTESYELAMYFMARHTAMDCFEKRNQRGYLFIIGDEMPYPAVDPSEVAARIGDKLQAPIPTEELVRELEKMYDVYFIIPNLTSHYDHPQLHKKWVSLLGQNVLRLAEPGGICELIASTIGVCEGTELDQVTEDLKEAGTELAVIGAVAGTLRDVASGRAKKGSEIAVPDSGAGSGVTTL